MDQRQTGPMRSNKGAPLTGDRPASSTIEPFANRSWTRFSNRGRQVSLDVVRLLSCSLAGWALEKLKVVA